MRNTIRHLEKIPSMRQKSFSDEGFEKYRKATRKETFLADMNDIIPWQELA